MVKVDEFRAENSVIVWAKSILVEVTHSLGSNYGIHTEKIRHFPQILLWNSYLKDRFFDAMRKFQVRDSVQSSMSKKCKTVDIFFADPLSP